MNGTVLDKPDPASVRVPRCAPGSCPRFHLERYGTLGCCSEPRSRVIVGSSGRRCDPLLSGVCGPFGTSDGSLGGRLSFRAYACRLGAGKPVRNRTATWPAPRHYGRPCRARTSGVGAIRFTSSSDNGLRQCIAEVPFSAMKASLVPTPRMMVSRMNCIFAKVPAVQRTSGSGPRPRGA